MLVVVLLSFVSFFIACQCSGQGSISPVCDSEGQCQCKPRYAGIKCDQCIGGYYSYPTCIACTCDKEGSTSDYCNPVDGQCQCKENFSGIFCNRCKPGFYGFPNCRECSCNPAGVRPLPGRPLGDCSASNTVSVFIFVIHVSNTTLIP